MTQN
jgi:hypothetical protein